ncbi:MAG: hypothetical protein C0615_03360 [Desulfuromonas sp.]|nr:MAG: hypothetical protein C0615_03360 [Desulfuromonas sp.]
MHNLHSQKGFTLVELLVALAITALLLTAVYQTVSSAANAREKLAVENSSFHAGRIITERIGRELRSLHFQLGDGQTRFYGGADGELLSFVTTASTPLAREPGVPARVSYRLSENDEDGTTTYTLNRIEQISLAFEPGRVYKLTDDLTTVELEFLSGDRWVDSWDSGTSSTLPEALRLSLTRGSDTEAVTLRTSWPLETH